MKKLLTLTIITTIIISLLCPICAYAVYYEKKGLGLEFALPEEWILESEDETSCNFNHATSANEYIMIEVATLDFSFSIDHVTEADILELCENLYSDENLAEDLSGQNNTYIRISNSSQSSGYEYHNNYVYYRYNKSYTASAAGFYDTQFHQTLYITAQNGKLYFYRYSRQNSSHITSLYKLLDNASYKLGEIKIYVDNEKIYPDSAPVILSGRALVPIRAVAEKMDYSVNWDPEKQTVKLSSKDNENILAFVIGENKAFKNNEEISLDVSPMIIGGRTFLPLRAVGEAMEADVKWYPDTRTITID